MMKSILVLLSLSSFAFAETDKPNFLFILADDLGIKDMSVEGVLTKFPTHNFHSGE